MFVELFYDSSASVAYSCNDQLGEESDRGTMEVLPPCENIKPAFTKKLKFQSALEGEPLELKCKIVAFPPPTVLWFHNNKSVPKTRRRRVRTIGEVHVHTTTLLFDRVKEKDAGSYRVMAINTEGSAESAASLLVSVNKEHSANYLSTARRSARAGQSTSAFVEQGGERKFRVDLRCVGSPFDKRSKTHLGAKSRFKTSLVRSVYFGSDCHSEDKATEKKSKFLETASERAPSPPPMFDRSEPFKDSFSDIYCDRRTGARFSDRLSDRCSDRYSERFSDTESLHNEVRAKLTTLQKAVKQRKRLSISTMSSSEFELDSVASESSYSDYVERLRSRPTPLLDVQHFSRPFDLGETNRESKSSTSIVPRPRARHSFEPQSRTRAIQLMKGELVDTLMKEDPHSIEESTGGGSDKQVVGEDPNLVAEVQRHHPGQMYSEPSMYTERMDSFEILASQERISPSDASRTKAATFVPGEVVTSEEPEIIQTFKEEYASECLMSSYEKSLEAERIDREEKLLALRIRKWQQGGQMPEEENHPATDQPGQQGLEYMEPNQNSSIKHVCVEGGSDLELEKMPFSYHKSPEVKPQCEDSEVLSSLKSSVISDRGQETQMYYTSLLSKSPAMESREGMKGGMPVKMEQRSPRATKRASEGRVVNEDRLGESPDLWQVQSGEDRVLGESVMMEQKAGRAELYEEEFAGESLRAHYEKSLEVERLQCEEKLLALRIRKWQQGMQMETPESESDMLLTEETSDIEPRGKQAVVTKELFAETAKSPKGRSNREHSETSDSLGKDKRRAIQKDSFVVSTTLKQQSPKTEPRTSKARPELSQQGLAQTEKMLFDKTKEECELQLSTENISEFKTESERLVSEEEALAQRIMKWQQDVLLEQEQSVELQPDWEQCYTLSQADKVKGVGSAAMASAAKVIQRPVVAHDSSSSAEQTAKEKFLMSETFPTGFQAQQSRNLPWLPISELLTKGDEAELESDSKYFVSEEEPLAQRILKWQENVEQEEVAKLESDLALDSQQLSTGSPIKSTVPSSKLETQHSGISHRADSEAFAMKPSTDQQVSQYMQSSLGKYSSKTIHASTSFDPHYIDDLTKASCDTKTAVKDGSVRDSSPIEKYSLSKADSRHSHNKHRVTATEFSGKCFKSDVSQEKLVQEEMAAFREISERKQQKAFESEESPTKSVYCEKTGIKTSEQEKDSNLKVFKIPESKMEQPMESVVSSCQPFFIKEISPVKVKMGEMTEFTCQFHGEPLPTVSWLKDGHSLVHNPDYDISNKANSSQLTIFYPARDHEGSYDCIITNKHGKSICSATLEIFDKKVSKKSGNTKKVLVAVDLDKDENKTEALIEKEIMTHVDSGMAMLQVPKAEVHRHQYSDDSLSCPPVEIRVTAATPVPMAQEEESYQDEPQIFAGKSSDVSVDERSSQAVRHTFTFSFDAVGEAPFIVSEMKDISCCEGNTAVLECTISGEPTPKVTWCYGNTSLIIASEKYTVEVADKVYRLYINSFTHSDAGQYKCVAGNKLGEVTSICNVSIQVPLASSAAEPDIFQRAIAMYSEHPKIEEKSQPLAVKAKKPSPHVLREPSVLSGCGLPTSSAVINVSQIKQAFEAGSQGPQLTTLEEAQKQKAFPEEFIPTVEASLCLQNEELEPQVGDKHSPAALVNLGSQKAVPNTEESEDIHSIFATGKTMFPLSHAKPKPIYPEISPEKEAVYQENGGAVQDILESPHLVKTEPQTPALDPKLTEAGEVVETREQAWPTFDRTSSFIPFQSEKVGPVKRSVRVAGTFEATMNPKRSNETTKHERPSTSNTDPGLDRAQVVVEDLSCCNTQTKQDRICEENVVIPTEHHESDMTEPNPISEPSLDSGVFLSVLDSQAGITEFNIGITSNIVEPHTQRKDKNQMIHEHVKPESGTLYGSIEEERHVNPLTVPKDALGDVPQSQDASREETVALEKTSRGEVIDESLEEEEVTFGAVYDYYNPPTDWGRPLSPESEMSIEIGSTVSEDIAEVAERFYTPGSSTEVSQPIAEAFYTPKSSSDIPGGFTTPQEYPFSPLEYKRPSTGDSSDRFFSPLLMSPADEGIETTTLMDNKLFLSKAGESLSLPTLKEKVQGIPPAFLKPLIKKRVLEHDSLTFCAEVFGLPSPDVKWFCNKTQLLADERVKIDRDGDCISLTIVDVTKADQGEYICEALNYVGEARSVALVIVVPEEIRFMPAPPAVTHQHVMEFDVEEDDCSRSPSPQEILLEVELDENEVKEFEKQVKIITIPEYTADNKSMIISLDVLPSIFEEGAVDFVSQEHDDLKIAFEVTEMPPRFINPICDMETPEGTTVMFECSLMGIPSPIVSWYKGDKKISHNNKKYLLSFDGDNHFLKICKVAIADSGVYSCRAINLVGETLCRASLVVISAKAFSGKTRGRELTAVSLGSAKVQPQKFDLMVGNTSFDGKEVSEIELEFEFEQEQDESQRAVRLVAKTDNETCDQGDKYVSINFDVFAEPAKEDKVEFKGKSSDVCSFQFQITEIPPKCIIPLSNIQAAVGTPVILQCLVSGKPNPSATWYKDGNRVTDSRCIIQEKTTGHFNLLITNASQSDAGEYKCVIQNTAGCIETTALLKMI